VFFEFPVTVTAGTLKAAPAVEELLLSAGAITRVDVQFPAGCSGMVHCSIWRGDHQLWPVNLDNDIAGEDAIVSWPESYDLADEPFSVIVKVWSPGTTYDHTITFRFALLSLEEMREARQAPGLLRRLSQLLLGRGV
jgi:hypothetical protein